MTGPATMMIGTLGQVPVRIPEGYSFALEEIQNGESRCMEYHLQIDKRIWFWDTFSWRKSKNRELTKALQSNSFQVHCTPERFILDSTGTPWDKSSQ